VQGLANAASTGFDRTGNGSRSVRASYCLGAMRTIGGEAAHSGEEIGSTIVPVPDLYAAPAMEE